VLYYIQDNNI